MKQTTHFWNRSIHWLLVLILVGISLSNLYVETVNAEITGTTYISPSHGYTITWQLPWYAVGDEIDDADFDVLTLADDRSMVFFSGGYSNSGSPAVIIEGYARQFTVESDWSEFHPLSPDECPVETINGVASACYVGLQDYGDGTHAEIGVFLQARDLGNGLDLLIEGYVPKADFARYLPLWQEFGIYPPGVAIPGSSANGCDSLVVDNTVFCFDPNLAERDRNDIAESTRLGQSMIRQYFGNQELPGMRVNGFASVASDGDENLATTLDRSVAVYTGSRVWQAIAPIERLQTVVHEVFHVYQNVMTAESDAVIPLWFTEGSAEAVGFLAAAQMGVADQTDFYDLAGFALAEFPVSETLDDLQPSGSMTADAYPLAYIAIQYLLGTRGLSVSALGDVYIELANGATFEQAFENVFGESVDRFTADFEQWRPSFARVDRLPERFWPNDKVAAPAAIELRFAPTNALPDQQIVLVGQTTMLATCTLETTLGTESIQRQTYADGAGSVFWLLSIPANTPMGLATIMLSCGSEPISTNIMIQ